MREQREPRRNMAAKLSGAMDRAAEIVSPSWAYRRKRARGQLRGLEMAEQIQRRNQFQYDGADTGHRLKNWNASGSSADAEMDEVTLDALRDRSNDRVRNTGLANTIINSIVENVVGHGLEPTLDLDADRLGITDSHASELRDQADEVYREWSPHADSSNRLHIADMQALALASTLVNGDVGIMPIHVEQGRAPSPLSLKLEMIEAHRIATPWGMARDKAGLEVRNGVSVGKRKQPLGFWISNEHPGDDTIPGSGSGSLKFRKIAAHNDDGSRRFLHLFAQKRVGQTRGEPMFAPVLADFKDLHDWKDAELVAAQVAACFAVFITQNDGPYGMAAKLGEQETPGGKRAQEVIPGAIMYGYPGEQVTGVDPGRPTSQYEAFYLAVSRQICSVSGMPLEVAMRDFSNTTYSQARAALLEARRSFANRQDWLIRYMMAPIWDRVLYEAWLRGRFDAGDFIGQRHLWTACNWETPGWGHIDEAKSMQAAGMALEMRVTTRADIARQLHGRRWSAINRQLAREDAEIASVGAEAQSVTGAGATAAADDSEAGAEPVEGSIVSTKLRLDAYGAGVRAGVITPQTDDETAIRAELEIPEMSDDAREAWNTEGGVRRPVTLSPPGEATVDDDEPSDDTDTDTDTEPEDSEE